MRPRDPFALGLVLVLYVLPLGAAVVLLALAGLPLIAGALVVVELVVAGLVVLARRPPRPTSPGAAGRSGWVVGAALVAVLAALVGVAVVASRFG